MRELVVTAGTQKGDSATLPPSKSTVEDLLGSGVDDGRHFLNTHTPGVALAVDEECGRGIHAEILAARLPHLQHIIEKLLVRQAGLEALLCKTGEFRQLQECIAAVLRSRPLLLLLEQHGNHREILRGHRAPLPR